MPLTIYYICPICKNESEVAVEPFVPAKISGPPESCYPAEGGDFDPDACPFCHKEFDPTKILEKAEEKLVDLQDHEC